MEAVLGSGLRRRRGLTKPEESAENSALSQRDGVETAAIVDEKTDPLLTELLHSWYSLHPEVRIAITTIIRASIRNPSSEVEPDKQTITR